MAPLFCSECKPNYQICSLKRFIFNGALLSHESDTTRPNTRDVNFKQYKLLILCIQQFSTCLNSLQPCDIPFISQRLYTTKTVSGGQVPFQITFADPLFVVGVWTFSGLINLPNWAEQFYI